ncbi:MAG: metal-dependent hydrolase [Anaerolineae bacterium]|nr:metal-dependent hydrolase [Anaerolineae bacterium]
MLVGHIAVALLQHHYLKVDLAPVVAGGLFPDVLDKTMCQVLHLTPSGRMWGHTLLGLALSSLAVRFASGRRAAIGWFAGYIGHLVADTGGQVPWLFPFASYEFKPSPGFREILKRFADDRREILIETGLLVWGLLWARHSAQANASTGNR